MACAYRVCLPGIVFIVLSYFTALAVSDARVRPVDSKDALRALLLQARWHSTAMVHRSGGCCASRCGDGLKDPRR